MALRPEVPRAIIGGTGFSKEAADFITVQTDYGDVPVGHLELGGKEIHFIARHRGLEVPHLVNYRANMQALRLLGVNVIYAVSACGRLAQDVLPGHLVGVSDIDWDDATGGRPSTFADTPGLLLHASMNDPFSPGLRVILANSWKEVRSDVAQLYNGSPDLTDGYHDGGTYFNINGPAFSPPAREARLRATVVNPKVIGQTLVPEVQLAREMGMAYTALGMVVDNSNYPGAKPVAHADGVMHAVVKTAQAARLLLDAAVRQTPDNFYDAVAHGAFDHSLHAGQVDFDILKNHGRTKLALILEDVLAKRSHPGS